MSRQQYDHWNEDADYVWYHEEGKHLDEPNYCDLCGTCHSVTFDCDAYFYEDKHLEDDDL